MKKYNKLSILLSAALIFGCAQEVDELKDPAPEEEPTGTLGANIDVSNFVTIGNSLVAGFQANALFTDGQNESIGKIIHQQMMYAGATGDFNQPDINSENGFSGFIPSTTIPLGRLILFDPDGATDPDGAGCLVSRTATPAASATPATPENCKTLAKPAVPAPYNTAASPLEPGWAYTGDKSQLNNFGVPGITVGELLVPASPNPAFNTYYARFATNPGTSTILSDVIAVDPTFFLLEIGNNDILGYATGGASNPAILTSQANFNARFNGVIATLLGNLPDAKGVVANIPDVTAIPFFFTVSWNAIEFKETDCDVNETLAELSAGFGGYNAALDGLAGVGLITAEEAASRKVTYEIGKNGVLIIDETLNNLSGEFDILLGAGAITPEQRAGLTPYVQVRQATSDDLITLPAGSVLGSCQIPPGGTTPSDSYIGGVSAPLADAYVLIPSEITEIQTRTAEFNAVIAAAVAANNTKLALADVNAAFNTFVSTQGATVNGIRLTPSITPPYAAFSEDGVHPNGRGYAFLANIFIEAINAKFGSTIPPANITHYRGTRIPITPTSSY